MATRTEAESGTAAATTVDSASLLEQAISATKQTERNQAQELLRTLTEEALKGTVTYSKNLTVTFNQAIKLIDDQLDTMEREEVIRTRWSGPQSGNGGCCAAAAWGQRVNPS